MTDEVRPSEQMRNLGVVQRGAPILTEAARTFVLPAERDAAEQAVDALFTAMERIAQVHPFAKGMGIAAPQIGIGRAAARGGRRRHRAAQPPRHRNFRRHR